MSLEVLNFRAIVEKMRNKSASKWLSLHENLQNVSRVFRRTYKNPGMERTYQAQAWYVYR
jgi:hypothetical protein